MNKISVTNKVQQNSRAGLILLSVMIILALFTSPVRAQMVIGMADTYRQAAASYRQAAAEAPADQKGCYNAWANYYDCLAAQQSSNGPSSCSAPTCSPGWSSGTEEGSGSSSFSIPSTLTIPSANAKEQAVINTISTVGSLLGNWLQRRAEKQHRREEAAEAERIRAEEAAEAERRRTELAYAERLNEDMVTTIEAEMKNTTPHVKANDMSDAIEAELAKSQIADAVEAELTLQPADLQMEFEPIAQDIISQVRDAARNKTRDVVEDQIHSLPDRFLDQLDDARLLSKPDHLQSSVSFIVRDLFEEEGETTAQPTIGGWIKAKITENLADWGTQELKKQLAEKLHSMGQESPCNGDEIELANCDLWRAANPANLSKGLKPYLEKVVNKWNTFWGLATDPFLDNTDIQK